ncbi:hypothetical protein [Streptomyces sp. NPDC049099]|uniref:hypothetical protein n=1 Tax=unclassified Streptomyces TaxID=2593676 RepID=UPI00341906B1
MRIRYALSIAVVGAALAVGPVATAAQAESGSISSMPSYCKPGSDVNYFGAHCATQRLYHVKAYCDHTDGRSKVLRGNDASNDGWSTIHCNTLGSGWRYRQGSGIVLIG